MKPFRKQFIECRDNGNCYISDKRDSFFNLQYLWCKKYDTPCNSKVCLQERIDKDEVDDNR